MKRILVPVDFSSHTGISCQYALSIARTTGAEIILFHSFFDQIYFSNGGLNTGFESGIMLTDEIVMDFFNQKELKLKNLADELKSILKQDEKTGINIIIRMESGDPDIQISHAIYELDPDLIIMGSGGMGKKGLLSGSVARHVVDNTEIPVIAVPDLSEVPSIRNVLYMTAFDDADPNVISKIDSVLSDFHVIIHCLHLLNDKNKSTAVHKMKELSENQLLQKVKGRIFFQTLEFNGNEDQLIDFIKTNEITLIAFIPHKRNIFKNIFYQGISREDLFLTHVPIMAVKPMQ
jgi:nucleotide-binding universal stress UspA family protein